MSIDKPYPLGPFETITNVHFGNDVIVAFISDLVSLKFNILKETATQLDQYRLVVSDAMPTFQQVTLFKIDPDAGAFVNVTALPGPSDLADFLTQVGSRLYVFVFAIDGAIGGSVARAKSGIVSALTDIVLATGGGQDPPGLLWSAGTNHLPTGNKMNWKIRYDNHRADNNPNNKMVQCYPLSAPYTTEPNQVTYTGYLLRAYRLDRKGTVTSYGSTDPYKSSGASVDPIWHQQISSDGNNDSNNYGVPFADPPPFIGVDIVNAHDLQP